MPYSSQFCPTFHTVGPRPLAIGPQMKEGSCSDNYMLHMKRPVVRLQVSVIPRGHGLFLEAGSVISLSGGLQRGVACLREDMGFSWAICYRTAMKEGAPGIDGSPPADMPLLAWLLGCLDSEQRVPGVSKYVLSA